MGKNEVTHWHALPDEQVFERLVSSVSGLNQETAQQRLSEVGPNELTADEGSGALKLLARQVNTPLIYLLLGAALVSLLAGKGIDAAVILGVVVLNTLLGFIQEWRAEGALAALREMAAPHARVLRNGEGGEIVAPEVVPGDVLLLETGDRVAADARLISGEDLRINESALTGESEPVRKDPAVVDEQATVADRRNMVWMSTVVTGGRGRAVVVGTGMRTEMGAIAHEVRETGRDKTPLQERMHKLGMLLGGAGVVLAAVVFGLGLLRGYETMEMLMFAVAVAVSIIPEGLPAVVTVTLALGVKRMSERHAIVRRLPAVETLGSTTVICSDKTGTITANQMTVRRLWAGDETFEVTGEGYQPEGELRQVAGEPLSELSPALQRLLRIGVLASNARLRQNDEGHWQAEGNPSEAALLVAAGKGGLASEQLRQDVERLAELPFSSDRKYMATLHEAENEGAGRVALVKGAPDRLLQYSTHILGDDGPLQIDDQWRDRIRGLIDQFAGEAMRVMAGAFRELPAETTKLQESDIETGLTLVGLWGMIDPPRAASHAAVLAAREAGIRPVMITGDHAATALAIARLVGITDGDQVLTASDVEGMAAAELAAATLQAGVFARVSPAHKLKIMEALKAHGEVVAMTGDGVNDAPALKGADIGVAMGRSGTEVAREAADMVLTDDNFATIVDAVEEGRTIYANLRRVVFFLLATNIGEVLTLAGALMLGLDLPLTAVMILWVNLVTDGACTIPLGVEPRHWDVLKLPPRKPDEPIVNGSMIRRMLILTPIMAAGTLWLFWYQRQNGDLQHARTVAFTTLSAFQWFQALNARSQFQSVFAIGFFSNRWLLAGLGTAVIMQVLVVHTALGQWLFKTTPLTWQDWGWIVLVSSTIWIVDEMLKLLGVHGRRPKH